jgi:hypothetical protein
VSSYQAAAIYRTRPAAVIVKPHAVTRTNQLLAVYDAGVISREALDQAVLDEIHRGSMLASWESARVELTGRRQGHCVEFEMYDRKGRIDGKWWTIQTNIIKQRSK